VLLIQMMEQQVKENKDGTKKEVTLVQTVRGNYKGFTKQEVIKAQEAREAQAMLGNPSKKDFQGLVRSNLIPNCPVARTNISNIREIFGPDLVSMKKSSIGGNRYLDYL
jgi:hypothetical protein